jgi:RNA polymerase sigma-70 factor (ECF subfamily)
MAQPPTEDDIRRIYRETIDDLYEFVSRRCDGDRDLAEDITQEAWLRAVDAWAVKGVPDRPFGWLATVAARLLSNHLHRHVTERFADGVGDTISEETDGPTRSFERRSLVERALARLPFGQRWLIEAFHFERRPVAEIASSTGLSERAVEGRLRRARQGLRREIEADIATEGDQV